MAPKLAAHQDAIFLNGKLFARSRRSTTSASQLELDPESLRLVEYDYQQFVRAGARLSGRRQGRRSRRFNEEDATLEAQFINQLLAATKAGALVTVERGRPRRACRTTNSRRRRWPPRGAGSTASGLIPLQNTTQQPDAGRR